MKFKALQDIVVFKKNDVFEIKGDEFVVKGKPATQPELFELVKDPTLGEKAREIREGKKLTARTLANSIGMSSGYIFSLEKNNDAYFRKNASYAYIQALESLSGTKFN